MRSKAMVCKCSSLIVRIAAWILAVSLAAARPGFAAAMPGNAADTAALSENITSKPSLDSISGDSAGSPQTATPSRPGAAKAAISSALGLSASMDAQNAPLGTREDTVAIFLQGARIGLGIGWALGSFGLFSQWERGLPDSLRRFYLSPLITSRDWGGAGDDTVRLRLIIRERPDAYNIHFPLYLTWTPLVRNSSHFNVQISGFSAWKTLLEAVRADSLSYTMDINHRLFFGTLAAGASFQYAIPRQWFSIDNVDASFFHVGMAFHPLSALFLYTSLSHSGALPDSLQQIASFLENAVSNTLHDAAAFGFGVSWRIGITALSSPTAGRGIICDIGYEGQWFGAFSEQGKALETGRINPAAARPAAPLQFLSHRLVIQIHFMWGKGGSERSIASLAD